MLKASIDFDVSNSVKKGLDYLTKPTPTATPKEHVEETEIEDENNNGNNGNGGNGGGDTTNGLNEPNENKYTDADFDESAESVVWVIDTLQQFILGFLGRRRLKKRAIEIAGENAMEKLQAIKEKIRQEGTVVLDVVEAQLRDLQDNFNEFIDNLKFTDFEKEQVLKPFKEIAREKNFVLTPWQRIAIASAMLIVPRLYVLRDM